MCAMHFRINVNEILSPLVIFLKVDRVVLLRFSFAWYDFMFYDALKNHFLLDGPLIHLKPILNHTSNANSN